MDMCLLAGIGYRFNPTRLSSWRVTPGGKQDFAPLDLRRLTIPRGRNSFSFLRAHPDELRYAGLAVFFTL